MVDPQAILRIQNQAQQARAQGHDNVTISVPVLLHLCGLALESPLVDEAQGFCLLVSDE